MTDGAPTRTPDRTGEPATRRRPRLALFALLAALALIALACGSSKKTTDAAAGDTSSTTAAAGSDGYGSTSESSTTSTAPSDSASGTSLSVATTSLGQVIVDDKGYTLYLFEKDTGPTSTCVDACAKAWPPATVTGSPTAGTGVTGALTTTTRADGTTQIVLAGHPLYRFAADTAPGDVTGQDVGGTWYAVSPAGATVE
jgi:predicted lipoprotein with Yx(FWY)xxD motif